MRAPLHRLKKIEIVWLAEHNCKHHHSYLEHYECFQKEQPSQRKIGFLDIEAYGLTADFGFMLSYCLKVKGEPTIYHNVLTVDDIKRTKNGDEDRRLIASCIHDIHRVDEIVTYYGNDYRYDVPFVRTRAVSMDIPFPTYGMFKQTDLYPVMKAKFRLARNRQENACRTLLGETEKNHIDGKIWRDAARGNKKSLGYVLDHNMRDVRDLERLYDKIIAYAKGVPGNL